MKGEIRTVDYITCQMVSNVPKYINAFESIGFLVEVDNNTITKYGTIQMKIYKEDEKEQ